MSFFRTQYYSIYTWFFFFFWETLHIVFSTNQWHEGRRKWQLTPVLLPGKSHGQRSLVGYSPWGREELDTIVRLHFHFSLSCIGEGNGNPLQYSCLENPGMGEPGGLPSLGSHRVGHDWSDLAAAAALASEWQSCDEGHVALTTKTLTHHLAFYEISVFPSALDVIFSLDLGPAPLPNSVRTLLTRKKGRK